MNILSVSLVETQTARTDLNQVLSSDRESKIESDRPSFAKALEDAKKADSFEAEKSEERLPADEEKVAKSENRSDSEADKKVSDSEKNPKNEKFEKIAKDEAESGENGEKIASTLGSADEIAARIQNFNNIVQNVSYIEENTSVDGENLAIPEQDFALDDKTIAWLTSSTQTPELSDEMSSEDFAKMIDAAVEFIPGFESEEEKLESAQNLAVKDPQRFLETLELAGSAEIVSNSAKIEQISVADKKIASADDKKEKKNDVKLSVHDLRTHHLFDESDAKIASDKVVAKASEKKEINLSMQKQADGNVQMTMELAAKAEQNITASSSQAAGATGSDFQAMLSNAVQDNAPDFVKAGNIILKDNNQGSINLILRPEGLGNVKISLNLDDKNLSAQITVQTKEAMDAFRESIPSLKQAFAESGFETGSFDLNFSNNQSNQQGFAQGENQNQQLFAQKTYGDLVTPNTPAAESGEAYADSSYGINIVA